MYLLFVVFCHLPLFTLAANFTGSINDETSIYKNGSELYKPLYPVHSNSTPRFHNVSGVTANPLIKALLGSSNNSSLAKRQSSNDLPVGTCAPGTPCVNGACCSNTGICGYSPDQCGSDVCISNCDAKAECGQYGVEGNNTCPLNVCCSKFGFCGTTDDFCGTGCQSGFGGCGPVDEPSCGNSLSAVGRTIGYYEGWSSTRACDKRLPSDLDVTGLTHVNFAFAYFDPATFEITPMTASDIPLYSQFTALKKSKASLRTWISIGGWSFNDATNTPNTQKAFSDMASSSANRGKFISSLIKFMRTYSFDGVDIDWEYPGAPDRGGIDADTENYVALLRDLRSAFGNLYGISVTLPASYWYLRWFDVVGMEQYLDFFNVMTYDIHGVWDSTNKFTGPYIRPHTNLTEIQIGLDLLWRNNIDPANVNMGFGWYGRSFTLADPGCNTPGCIFSAGGNPGECTKSSGTLSNAEITRIIAANGLTPAFDKEAAVKWITWNSNQWVSYDDGETMALKIAAANKWCLGGKLIWSIDQDDSAHTSNTDILGLGSSNGVTPEIAKEIKDAQLKAEIDATTRNSCYWTFCGEECTVGYFATTQAKGQVLGIQRDTVCRGDSYQTLCCAPGTNMGTCSWEGWRGVGMACSAGGCHDNSSLVAVNTNQYGRNLDVGTNINRTCNGGQQSYCCDGFVPSPSYSTDDLDLVGQNGITKRKSKGGKNPACVAAVETGALILGGLLSFVTFGLGAAAFVGVSVIGNAACPTTGSGSASGNAIGVMPLAGIGAMGPNGGKPTTSVSSSVTGKPTGTLAAKVGQWNRVTYANNVRDCAVTYTCKYGQGWNEVCDNQRWAIDKKLNHKTVYHIGSGIGRSFKQEWPQWRIAEYRTLAQAQANPGERARCEADEFPMANLDESKYPNPQVVRLVNGAANGAQGLDFKNWKTAVWQPCAEVRAKNNKTPPPVTWEFGPFTANDPRATASSNGLHFIQKYGFDSQTAGSQCWATYTKFGSTGHTTVLDHGFRGLVDDPMFGAQYRWTKNNYLFRPDSSPQLPTNVASAQYMRRRAVQSALEGKISVNDVDNDHAENEYIIVKGYNDDDDSSFWAGEYEDYMMYAKAMAEGDTETSSSSPPPPEPTDPHTVFPSVPERASEASGVALGPRETGAALSHLRRHMRVHERSEHHP